MESTRNKAITLTAPPELFKVIESRAKKADKPVGAMVRFMVKQCLSYEQFLQQVPEFKKRYEQFETEQEAAKEE